MCKDNFKKDFYALGKNNLTQDLDLSLKKSFIIIDNLRKSDISNNLLLQKKNDLLLLDYKHLQKQFELYFDYTRQLGSTEYGIYNKLINSSLELQKRLNLLNKNDEIVLLFNQTRSMQALFHFSFDKSSYNFLQKQNNIIENLIKKRDYNNNYNYYRINDSFKEYKSVFNLFSRKKMQIGFNNDFGLVNKINNTFIIVENRLNESSEIIYLNKYRNVIIYFIAFALLSFVFLIISYFFSRKFYLKHILFINETLKIIENIDKGILFENNELNIPFEFRNIIDSLNGFSKKLLKTAKILLALPDRKINIEITDSERVQFLNDSLLKIWKNFELNDNDLETEKQGRFISDWVKTGLEKFTGILRKEFDDVNLLSKELLNNLIEHLNIAVGAIYLKKEIEKSFELELVSSFAFGKEKLIKKKIEAGEGIIGTAAVEKNTLNITNVPANYFKVSSGFGNAMPRNVLIIPVIFENEIFGIIELASFKIIQNYELEFIEELAKAFAATLSANKAHENIKQKYKETTIKNNLLENEKSKLQNNISDLSKDFEELNFKNFDYEIVKRSIDSYTIIFDINIEGYVLSVNNQFYKVFKTLPENIKNINYFDYLYKSEKIEEIDIDKFWNEIKIGISKKLTHKINVLGENFWLYDDFIPIKNNEGIVYKVKVVSRNITDYKELEKNIEKAKLTIQELDLNNENNIIIIDNLKLKLKNSNNALEEIYAKNTEKEAQLNKEIEELRNKLAQK
ncbi:MAG: GAF domain-containing protein [Bacteroidales bacterium]|nr:GAF domain-containing protein [Bacteroidales bacterium]